MSSVIPSIINSKVKEYEKSEASQIRSMRVLYESGLLGKRKYTSIRNSSDILNEPGAKQRKSHKAEIIAASPITVRRIPVILNLPKIK